MRIRTCNQMVWNATELETQALQYKQIEIVFHLVHSIFHFQFSIFFLLVEHMTLWLFSVILLDMRYLISIEHTAFPHVCLESNPTKASN